jgi:hypothetical protein
VTNIEDVNRILADRKRPTAEIAEIAENASECGTRMHIPKIRLLFSAFDSAVSAISAVRSV